MSTITVLGQPAASTRKIQSFIGECLNALQDRRKHRKVRAALYAMDDRSLKDIGIAYGEIEYVASHPDSDPRGV